MSQLTLQERQEYAMEAGETLKDKVFLAAIAKMKAAAVDEIIRNIPGSLTSRAACAKLQVLNEFLNELSVIRGDGAMAAKQGK